MRGIVHFVGQGFRSLFWTQFFGALNDNVFKNALVVLVAYKGASVWGLPAGSVVALAGGLFILPFMLFSPLAGQICDKYERSRLVRATKWWELAIMCIAAWGLLRHDFGFLLVVLFCLGIQATFFGPLKYSMLPDLVPPARLSLANGYVEGGTFLAILLGTMLGGALVALPGGEWAVMSVLLLLAVVGVVCASQVPQVEIGSPALRLEWNPWPTLRAKHQMLLRTPNLYRSVLLISWFWFYGAVVLSILPVFGKETLHVHENVVTAFLSLFTIGIGVGSVLAGRRADGGWSWMRWAAIGMTLFLIDVYAVQFSWAPSSHMLSTREFWSQALAWRLAFDMFALAVCGGVFVLPLYTALQTTSRVDERSRVIASLNIWNAIFMVVSAGVVMLLRGFGFSDWELLLTLAIMNAPVGLCLRAGPNANLHIEI